ncbi:MAG: type II CAAX endopeptidase family protein [Candidatus Thorarchaeota archaeon]
MAFANTPYRFLLFMMVLFIGISVADVATRVAPEPLAPVVSTLAFFGFYGLMILSVKVLLWTEDGGPLVRLGLDIDNRTLPLLAVGGLGGILSAGYVYVVALFLGGSVKLIAEVSSDMVISQGIITALVALVEEICYRGYLMTRLAESFGRPAGVIISSAFFSLMHYSWWFGNDTVTPELVAMFSLNLFVGGMVLGLSYYATGRVLWTAVGFHYFWNMMAYTLFPVFPRDSVASPILFQIEWGMTTIPAFLLGLLVMVGLLRISDLAESSGR